MPSGSIAFDRAAGFYDATRGFPPGEEVHVASLLAALGDLNENSRILEIGIGTGRIALPIAAHVHSIYGVDLARPMMARLREKQRGERIYLTEGDATQLPLASHRFDGAVIVHVLHLIPNWRVALRELARALRPGARLLVGRGGGRFRPTQFDPLWEAFTSVIPEERTRRVGLQDEEEIVAEGWQPVGEKVVHVMADYHTPQGFIDAVAGRSWSSLWSLPDEDLARAVDAVRKAALRLFPDLTVQIEFSPTFEAQAYRPPERN